jgi:hypothetical protein
VTRRRLQKDALLDHIASPTAPIGQDQRGIFNSDGDTCRFLAVHPPVPTEPIPRYQQAPTGDQAQVQRHRITSFRFAAAAATPAASESAHGWPPILSKSFGNLNTYQHRNTGKSPATRMDAWIAVAARLLRIRGSFIQAGWV